MRASQDGIFAEFEGDRWFGRNREALERFDPQDDPPLRLMDLYGLRPRRVLEVGAANGLRLATIARQGGVRAVAVEPSAQAVTDGRARFPEVEFVRGEAHAVPLDASFDLIIANFVFHWIDRARLLGSVAEIDRLLEDGGFLMIGDFCPPHPTRVAYHHLPEHRVYTYKQDYAAPFLASGLYLPVGFLAGDHASKRLLPAVAADSKAGVWLLRKSLSDGYADRPF